MSHYHYFHAAARSRCRCRILFFWLGLAVFGSPGARARLVGYIDKNGQAQIVDASTRTPWPKLDEPARSTFQVGNLAVTVVYCDVILHVGHGFDDPTSGPTRRATDSKFCSR